MVCLGQFFFKFMASSTYITHGCDDVIVVSDEYKVTIDEVVTRVVTITLSSELPGETSCV